MSRFGLAVLVVFAVLLFRPDPARSQVDDRLEAAELAADAGDADRARRYLQDWLHSEAASRPEADVGRALFLRARLASNVDSAEVDYLEAAVRGGERYAALARLRLAQLRLTEGRPVPAAADLEKLRADFPGSPLVPESWLWTGLALEALGNSAAACAAWTKAASGALSDTITAQATEELSKCTGGQDDTTDPSGYTVQLGAFGSRAAADEVRSRAADTGVEARVHDPDASTPLYRVRVGHFASSDAAARLAVRLRSEGFEAIVVSGDP